MALVGRYKSRANGSGVRREHKGRMEEQEKMKSAFMLCHQYLHGKLLFHSHPVPSPLIRQQEYILKNLRYKMV
jgi:hypothetical protein